MSENSDELSPEEEAAGAIEDEEVLAIEVDSLNVSRLTASDSDVYLGFDDPSWAPDGRELVASINVATPSPELVIVKSMNPDGWSQVTDPFEPNNRQGAWAPAWSPSGDRIAFIDYRGNIYTIRPDGQEIQRVIERFGQGSTTRNQQVGPWATLDWTDGDRFLVGVGSAPHPRDLAGLWIGDMAQESLSQIVEVPIGDASWSPDGKAIAFITNPDRLLGGTPVPGPTGVSPTASPGLLRQPSDQGGVFVAAVDGSAIRQIPIGGCARGVDW